MSNQTTLYIPSQMGTFSVTLQGSKVSAVRRCNKSDMGQQLNDKTVLKSETTKKIQSQFKEYFSSAETFEKIDLAPEGTVFQKKVWRELLSIPLGETRTYGEIAQKLNSGARAVGNACRKNPILILIPCHRVISKTGIGGYAGSTTGDEIHFKRTLLQHEGCFV